MGNSERNDMVSSLAVVENCFHANKRQIWKNVVIIPPRLE